jgi:hypothetical protein
LESNGNDFLGDLACTTRSFETNYNNEIKNRMCNVATTEILKLVFTNTFLLYHSSMLDAFQDKGTTLNKIPKMLNLHHHATLK